MLEPIVPDASRDVFNYHILPTEVPGEDIAQPPYAPVPASDHHVFTTRQRRGQS